MASALLLPLILTIPLWGYGILTGVRRPGVVAWMLTAAFIVVIYFFADVEPLMAMFLYIASTFLSMKVLMVSNHLGLNSRLKFTQWLLFCYGWFGMNPRPFLAFPARAFPDWSIYLIKGITRVIAGLAVINAGHFILSALSFEPMGWLLHLCYLVGLSLILHFGVLNIFTGILRRLGINVTSLFKDPLRSRSLDEFWSRRWNLAFVELTTIAVLRPVKSVYGAGVAFWASFVFSGLLHELAISLPVKDGYGKPFLYFVLQAALILVIDPYVIRKQTNSRVRTTLILACLFLPIFLLFHEAFIRHVVIPLVGYLIMV